MWRAGWTRPDRGKTHKEPRHITTEFTGGSACGQSVPRLILEVFILVPGHQLCGGSGHCNSCNTLPHCLGALGSGTPAMHRFTAWGQLAVQLVQCTASLPGGSGQWYSRTKVPRCMGAAGTGTLVTRCLTA